MNDKKTIKQLENIAEYYKNKWQLNTFIDISSQGLYCNYSRLKNIISISLEYINKVKKENDKYNFINRNYLQKLNIKELYIFALLHELAHSIDYKYKSNRFENEIKTLKPYNYIADLQYHNKFKFEIRADKFAKRELKKWIK